MTTYRIVPAEPTQEQIERGEMFCSLNGVELSHSQLRAVYIAMTEQCPEVSGEPVAFVDESDLLDMVKGLEPTISRGPVSEYDVPLYTTPQPDSRDAEIARLKEALEGLSEAADSLIGTIGCIRGDTPEDDDTHVHEKWAAEFLAERNTAAITTLKGVIE